MEARDKHHAVLQEIRKKVKEERMAEISQNSSAVAISLPSETLSTMNNSTAMPVTATPMLQNFPNHELNAIDGLSATQSKVTVAQANQSQYAKSAAPAYIENKAQSKAHGFARLRNLFFMPDKPSRKALSSVQSSPTSSLPLSASAEKAHMSSFFTLNDDPIPAGTPYGPSQQELARARSHLLHYPSYYFHHNFMLFGTFLVLTSTLLQYWSLLTFCWPAAIQPQLRSKRNRNRHRQPHV